MAKPKPEWCAEKAARIAAYPKTKERYEQLRIERSARIKQQIADGNWFRTGVPTGWRGRKAEVAEARAKAAEEAKKIVSIINDGSPPEDPRAVEALEYAVTVIRASGADGTPTEKTRERLAAAKLVLEYTKQKPASKVEMSKAEDFLAVLHEKTLG